MNDPYLLLDAYGAKISAWPRSRAAGYIALISSSSFRRAWHENRQLDRALNEQAGLSFIRASLSEAEKGERRLLARMGVGDDRRLVAGPVGGRFFAGLAVASLCFGLIVGGFAGDAGLGQEALASNADILWDSVIEDSLGSDLG